MKRLAPQIVVEDTSGQRGVTTSDFMSCCTEGETPVVWDGETSFSGTDTDTIKVIGPENAVADPQKCGAGRGADCCIFLATGVGGFECHRFSSLRVSLIFKKTKAERHPESLYPACQLVPK